MKISKIVLRLYILIMLTVINSYAQEFTLKTMGSDQFLHHITAKNIGSEGSYIETQALNNKPNAQANTPEARVKSFYSWYLKSMVANSHFYYRSLTKTFLNANFSKRFDRWYYSKEARNLDYDPFLMGNGPDAEGWSNRINVGKVTITGNMAVVKLSLGSPPEYTQRIKISLLKEAGTWKIDRIDD